MVIDSETASQGLHTRATFASSPTPSFSTYPGNHDLSIKGNSSASQFKPFMDQAQFKPFLDLGHTLDDPSLTLSDRAKILQNTAASALTLYAKENPSVQRLVEAHQNWETNLRTETQRRLEGFQPEPFLRQSGLLDEDVTLLNRARMPARSLLNSSGMKKSLSTGNFEGFSSAEFDAPSTVPSGSLDPTARIASGSHSKPTIPAFDPVTGTRRFGIHSNSHHRYNNEQVRELQSQAMIKAHSTMSLEELSTVINIKAQRKLEAFLSSVQHSSQVAIQQAQSSIKETASNLEGNLQLLSTIFSQNMTLTAPGAAKVSLITWHSTMAANGPSVSGGGALVSWDVLRSLRLLEGLGVGEVAGSDSDWIKQLDQYMQQMGRMQHDRAVARSVRDPGRQVAIVTTAALPWMTGTSINPLLRAAYLSSDEQRKVTLVIPWLSKIDQDRVFPDNMSFETPEQQEVFVRDWARKRTGLACNFKIAFYPGRYAVDRGFIMPVGDITSVIPDGEADVAVLEEPEHLTWYHHGSRWSEKFNQVVGIMHTNYLDYVRREEGGAMNAFMLEHFNRYVCGVHCDKVIKLSDAVQGLPRQHTMFVHGVSPSFLRVGAAKAGMLIEDAKKDDSDGSAPRAKGQLALIADASSGASSSAAPVPAGRFSKGAYFLGKALWAKGYTELVALMKEHADRTGESTLLDIYGHGPELAEIEKSSKEKKLALKFNGAKDHADSELHDYKVFINPSLSDVVATTTAEALAMGKFVVCADHPSNKFFQQYDNCLIYRNSEEFSQCLNKALSSEPKPLSKEELHSLSWEAATDRFLDVADITTQMQPLEAVAGSAMYSVMNTLLGNETFRQSMGAGADTRDRPACNLADYQPSQQGGRMLFDLRPADADPK